MQLRKYQQDGRDFMASTGRRGNADDMGLGKTIQALAAATKLNAERVLIVCPNIARSVWIDHIELWDPEATYIVIDRKLKDRVSAIESRCKYTIINYALLIPHRRRTDKEVKITPANARMMELEGKLIVKADVLDALKKQPYDTIIIDEAHNLRNRKSQAFLSLQSLCRATRVKNILPLTGTPILNKVQDIWPALNLLDPKRFSSYWRFVNEHCQTSQAWFDPRITLIADEPRNIDFTRGVIGEYFIRRSIDDQLDMPPLQFEPLDIEMTPEQARYYKQMKLYNYIEIGDWIVEAVNPLARDGYLRQIAISHMLMDNDSDSLEGGKLNGLMEILSSIGNQQVVIFSQFARVIARLNAILSASDFNCVCYMGGISDKAKAESLHKFRSDPTNQIMLATIQACGVAIDLTVASIVIFIDYLWTPALNAQALSRVYRPPQSKPVTAYVFTTSDSVENDIVKTLRRKQDLFDKAIPTIHL